MMYEGRKVRNNGCRKHRNCLTCPFEECFLVLADKKEEVSEEIALRRAKHNAYYHKNKERIKQNKLRRDAEKNIGA